MLRLIGMAAGAVLVISAARMLMNRKKAVQCVKGKAPSKMHMRDKHGKRGAYDKKD